ncbi:hypothetical protein RA11412_1061 [Rothia aeria]|uniref:Uncharacterized protein n=1 Tax=Rothia aeria TaxID=172042 RepID=A0A2Z5QYH2_9MICC|nr:hypothetical protein RA11412_1061 [Rothia aeria]
MSGRERPAHICLLEAFIGFTLLPLRKQMYNQLRYRRYFSSS